MTFWAELLCRACFDISLLFTSVSWCCTCLCSQSPKPPFFEKLQQIPKERSNFPVFLEASPHWGFLQAHKSKGRENRCHLSQLILAHCSLSYFIFFFFKRVLLISWVQWSSFLLSPLQNRFCAAEEISERKKLNHEDRKNDQRKNIGTT